jgi:hypothetical protein
MSQFELEGVEIRIQQKPIAEFVSQSVGVTVDYTTNPKIYLGEDGLLYFYDDTLDTPISLKKATQFYKRLQLVDGELRFYDSDMESYINLSFFVNSKKQFVDKPNSLINNNTKRIEKNSTYDSREVLLKILEKESLTRDTTVNANSILTEILDVFFNSIHIESGLTVAKYIINNFTYGLSNELKKNSNIFNLDTGLMINKEIIINENNFGVLEDKLYSFLVNESAKIIQGYDGLGKLVYGLIGPKKMSEIGNGLDILLPVNNYNITSANNFINIDAVSNAMCGYIEDESVFIGKFLPGKIAFKYASGQTIAVSGSGLVNIPVTIPISGCSINPLDPSIVGVVQTTLGDLSFNNVTVFDISTTTDIYSWFRDFNATDNSGAAIFDYVYTPAVNIVKSEFSIDAITNASWTTLTDVVVENISGDVNRKLVGIFDFGEIVFSAKNGYVRSDSDFSTQFNTIQDYGISGDNNFEYGFINSSLGPISFVGDTTYEIPTANFLLEVWYEDFDNNDNTGLIQYTFNYTSSVEIVPSEDDRIAYLGPLSTKNEHLVYYALDSFCKIASSYYHGLWYDRFLECIEARNQNNFNKITIYPDQYQMFLDDVNLRIKDDITYSGLYSYANDIFYGAKKYYEKSELTELSEGGIIDFRNYFMYHGGSGINDIVNRNLQAVNNIWIDVPNMYSVVPKLVNGYAISTFVNFTADYSPGLPCTLEFRLYDSTADVELDKLTYIFDRYSNVKELGNLLFENKETLHVQLCYFGPVSSILCQTTTLRKAVQDDGRNINSHILLDADEIYPEDGADTLEFKIITDRIEEYLNSPGRSANGKNEVKIKAPRVLRVQWRMSFSQEIGDKDQVKYDIGRFQFNSFAPSVDATISTNLYSFGEAYKSGLTVQGIAIFGKNKKRVTVTDEQLSVLTNSKYSIALSCSKNVNVWHENKTNIGFDIVAEKEFEGEVSWFVISQRDNIQTTVRQDDEKFIPDCIINRRLPYNELTDYDILYKEGYFDTVVPNKNKENPVLGVNNITSASTASFIDPNGVGCSKDCLDDCPDGYVCSNECYTAALTESGCGCCECLNDSNCPEGYICNELNECVEI